METTYGILLILDFNKLQQDYNIEDFTGNLLGAINTDICPFIKDNRMWLGQSIHSGDREFRVSDEYSLQAAGYRTDEQGNKYIRVKGVRWFINLDYQDGHKCFLMLHKRYNQNTYHKFDNYNAINIDKVADIPYDYDGIMGVPITFIDKYNPEQFEIIGISADFAKSIYINGRIKENPGRFYLNINDEYKRLYDRILIKRRNNNK